MTTRLLPLTGVLLALLLPLSACGGNSEKAPTGDDPATVLAHAKQKFDAAKSVHLTLSTDSRPTSGNAVLGAKGTLTDAPAFKGDVDVFLGGIQATVPVVSVGGKVYAKLPLTTSYAAINPGEYGAPDPADFADPSKGISTLLTQMQDARKGNQVREGKQILTSYRGTLAGAKVKPIIPSASTASSYDTVIGIDESGWIRTLKVTGEFFSGAGDETYDLVLGDYDKPVTITKP